MPDSSKLQPASGAVATPAAGRPVTVGGHQAPTSGMQTAVQLTFSFEIASLQLRPNFKMGALQLKPTSKIVTMRLAPSQQPQPAMNLQVTFEIATVQAAGGGIGQIRLTPSQQQRPGVVSSPAFNIAGLQLLSGTDAGAVQLTPSQQGQASVQVTGRFQIATVEFSPSFEIASLVLNATSKSVSVQLPGAGLSSVEGAPVFEIANLQVTGNGQIGMMQLNAQGPTLKPQPVEIAAATISSSSQITTRAVLASDDMEPFHTVLNEAGTAPEKTLVPRLAVTFALPMFSSADEFAEHALNGRFASTLDLTAWVTPTEEFDHCVFLALYESGVVRPISTTIARRGERTFLTFTDPLCFLDPGSSAEEFETGMLSGSFDLVGLRLPRHG